MTNTPAMLDLDAYSEAAATLRFKGVDYKIGLTKTHTILKMHEISERIDKRNTATQEKVRSLNRKIKAITDKDPNSAQIDPLQKELLSVESQESIEQSRQDMIDLVYEAVKVDNPNVERSVFEGLSIPLLKKTFTYIQKVCMEDFLDDRGLGSIATDDSKSTSATPTSEASPQKEKAPASDPSVGSSPQTQDTGESASQ